MIPDFCNKSALKLKPATLSETSILENLNFQLTKDKQQRG